jgi:hypothetical protein
VFDQFDDLLLLREGAVVYHGDKNAATKYFAGMGFHKGGAEEDVADWFVNLVADPSKTLTRCALVPIRPRSRGERRFLRTFPGVYLRPAIAFNPRPRCLSNPPDAFQLHQG